jgi:hypothetical protein
VLGRAGCTGWLGFADFAKLVATAEVQRWIAGSGCGADLKFWVDARAFITQAFNRPGTILDVGCANGFLLRCFQEWTEHQLTPFGIDPSSVIHDAVVPLYRAYSEGHFAKLTLDEYLVQAATPGSTAACFFPAQFDFVYWNVWDNCTLEEEMERGWVHLLFARVKAGGRIVFGLYDTPLRNDARVAILRSELGHFGEVSIIRSAAGLPHMAVVVAR